MSLAIDRNKFNAQFARTPFLVPHQLAGHRLFTLASLVELSKRLPASQVEYNAGEVPVGLDPARTPRNGLSPARHCDESRDPDRRRTRARRARGSPRALEPRKGLAPYPAVGGGR